VSAAISVRHRSIIGAHLQQHEQISVTARMPPITPGALPTDVRLLPANRPRPAPPGWSCHAPLVKFDEPRRLTKAETDIVSVLLAPDFPGASELRAQVPEACAVGLCGCGCPSVEIEVPPSIAPSPVQTRSRLAPFEGRVSPLADEPPGDIILFVDDGYLSYLEYVSYVDLAPTEWPPLSRVSVLQRE
jgi:hypothetical protein